MVAALLSGNTVGHIIYLCRARLVVRQLTVHVLTCPSTCRHDYW